MSIVGSSNEQESAAIATDVRKCKDLFEAAQNAITDDSTSRSKSIRLSDVQDVFGRFKMWSANIAAHARGRRSLDYRLRDASHIRVRIEQSLAEMAALLQTAIDIISGIRIPWDEEPGSDDDLYLGLDDQSAGFTEDEDEVAKETELQQIVQSLDEIIVGMLRLSMAIRSPAPYDQMKHSRAFDSSFWEQYDINHVRERFRNDVEDYLCDRLGRAITTRRRYLKYREEHHKKLTAGFDQDEDYAASRHGSHASTIASSLPLMLQRSPETADLADTASEGGHSGTTFDASSGVISASLYPPAIPEQGIDEAFFECPICFVIISVPDTHSWYEHVYQDLRPYVCTLATCKTPGKLFESEHAWFDHEMREQMELDDGVRFFDTSSSRVNDFSMQEIKCSLCPERIKGTKELRKHVGKHQRALSLFALPTHLYENTEDEERISNGSISESHLIASIAAHDLDSAHQIEDEKKARVVRFVNESLNNGESGTEPSQERQLTTEEKRLALKEIKRKIRELEIEIDMESRGTSEQDFRDMTDHIEAPVKFEDCIGRKFTFPWEVAKSWKGMENMIDQAFFHDTLGDRVIQGHYDLIGPTNEIIFVQNWEQTVQPGWKISMKLWPLPEADKKPNALSLAIPSANSSATVKKDKKLTSDAKNTGLIARIADDGQSSDSKKGPLPNLIVPGSQPKASKKTSGKPGQVRPSTDSNRDSLQRTSPRNIATQTRAPNVVSVPGGTGVTRSLGSPSSGTRPRQTSYYDQTQSLPWSPAPAHVYPTPYQVGMSLPIAEPLPGDASRRRELDDYPQYPYRDPYNVLTMTTPYLSSNYRGEPLYQDHYLEPTGPPLIRPASSSRPRRDTSYNNLNPVISVPSMSGSSHSREKMYSGRFPIVPNSPPPPQRRSDDSGEKRKETWLESRRPIIIDNATSMPPPPARSTSAVTILDNSKRRDIRYPSQPPTVNFTPPPPRRRSSVVGNTYDRPSSFGTRPIPVKRVPSLSYHDSWRDSSDRSTDISSSDHDSWKIASDRSTEPSDHGSLGLPGYKDTKPLSFDPSNQQKVADESSQPPVIVHGSGSRKFLGKRHSSSTDVSSSSRREESSHFRQSTPRSLNTPSQRPTTTAALSSPSGGSNKHPATRPTSQQRQSPMTIHANDPQFEQVEIRPVPKQGRWVNVVRKRRPDGSVEVTEVPTDSEGAVVNLRYD